jgi:hypothetical protein
MILFEKNLVVVDDVVGDDDVVVHPLDENDVLKQNKERERERERGDKET